MPETKIEAPQPQTWQEKAEAADKLFQETKAQIAAGVKDGLEAEELHRKMAQARQWGQEVKEQKDAEKIAALQNIVVEYEKQKSFQEEAPARTNDVPLVNPGPEDNYAGHRNMGQILYSKRMVDDLNLKVMTQGTNTAGGFLVAPRYANDLFAEARLQGNAIRRYGFLAEHPVTTNLLYLPVSSGGITASTVAEDATKPTADAAFTQVAVNMYTIAGIAKMTRQLAEDSAPTVEDLVSRELGGKIGNEEERWIVNGSGTNEPRGILNTTGVNAVTYTDATPTGQETLDAIIDAIAAIQQNYFAPANGILMHPRRLAFLQKSKDTQNNYLFNDPGTFRAPGGFSRPVGATSQTTGGVALMPGILGLPVGTSMNVPINLGAGTNEDRIIVADWNEAHWFTRTDIRFDTTDQAGTAFEKNEIWIRGEERAGFTAARYPKAFAVVSGTGLI